MRRGRRAILGGVVAVMAVAVVGVSIVLVGSGGTASSGSTARPTPGASAQRSRAQAPAARQQEQAVNALLAGIPQSGTRLGNATAPVTMYYFGDLECPVCRDFTLLGGLSQLIAKDVRAGSVRIVYRSFCTATCNGPGPQVFARQQIAAYAAGMQGRFWDYAELFYREQGQEGTGYVTEAYLDGLARQTPGLDYSLWQKDRGDPSLLAQVQADEKEANRLRLPGTPTLIMQGPRGAYEVPQTIATYAQLQQAIAHVR